MHQSEATSRPVRMVDRVVSLLQSQIKQAHTHAHTRIHTHLFQPSPPLFWRSIRHWLHPPYRDNMLAQPHTTSYTPARIIIVIISRVQSLYKQDITDLNESWRLN